MSEQPLPKIEGISPDMIWTFLVVLVGLIALVVLGDKVMDVFRNAMKRRKERREVNGQDITDKIADKVIEKLTPTLDEKFNEINRRLDDDRTDIDAHERRLNAQDNRVDRLDDDTRALLHGMSALLSHEVNGSNTEKLIRTQAAISNYLIDHVYKEDDWK